MPSSMVREWRIGLAGLCLLATTPASSSRTTIDLSHQPHLKPQTIAETIKKAAFDDELLHVDVSFSELGDDGVKQVFSSIQGGENLRLAIRMNRLTPIGGAALLHSMNEEESKAVDSLDMSWNNFHHQEAGSNKFLVNLRNLVENDSKCPREIRLDRCSLGPAACRAIGKGIMNRYKKLVAAAAAAAAATPISLHLCGNPDIGDAGAAAMAASIRTSPPGSVVFDVLDLSACGIGDDGAKALALALESHPGCVKRLVLSHNQIQNEGAAAIGRSIALDSLRLDNNPDIGNQGAIAIAEAFGRGVFKHLSFRSCSLYADGMQAFGQALKTLAQNNKNNNTTIKLDVSGNPIGILRKKKKVKLYSASVLKSKASATTASYMKLIGKKIQSGLRDVGLDGFVGSPSGESDDEEDERMGANEVDPAKAPCGAKAFADTLVSLDHQNKQKTTTTTTLGCKLGMRHCYLDQGAADALGAAVLQARDRFGVDLTIDATYNQVLEESMVDALMGKDRSALEDMSERHMEALEALRAAEERATQAAAAARARLSPPTQWYNDDDDDDEGYDDFGYDEDDGFP